MQRLFKINRPINITTIIVISFFLLTCTKVEEKKEEVKSVNTQQIFISSIKGGDWHSNSTWIQGNVPTPDADVNITGKVTINGKAECLNLLIDNGATLELSTKAELVVKHHVINEGTIINNGSLKTKDDN
ncbi:hypothetical protein D9V86_03765 [Bacteroidetes/Chlorobi group bacterium ChocPot_Mid]|jgi:hypothetical protein|nr:MAG: hypothetical protein D9V86_03765 [Bacteroidetes/Chlorobi group bacterium ChocPot_Mid]